MANVHLEISKRSHHFVCKALTPRAYNVCSMYAKRFIKMSLVKIRRRFVQKPVAVFATKTKDGVEFRFHINVYDDFVKFMEANHIMPQQTVTHLTEACAGESIEISIKPQFQPRDQQPEVIDYLMEGGNNKLVTLQPGDGKSLISLFTIAKFKLRTAIIVRPQFMEKWYIDILDKTDCDPDDILMISGSANLMALTELAYNNQLTAKFIIISNKTIQRWYGTYKENRNGVLDLGYRCTPDELFNLCKCGIRLVDEVHLDLHLQCLIDLYTNVKHSISLTGTMLSNDVFTSKMQEMMYPLNKRFSGAKLTKYIDVIGVNYSIKDMSNIRTSDMTMGSYSHTAFEKSIMRNRPMLLNYLGLIDKVMQSSFMKVKREKKKLLVYIGSIMLCDIAANYFRNKYPQFDVRTYCEDDPYENLIEPDIRFTTLLSAGVGHDIPDLTNTILTVALSSMQSNIQALGRLRKLPDEHPVEFHYLSCTDIPKHMEYQKEKEKMFRYRVKSHKVIDSGIII